MKVSYNESLLCWVEMFLKKGFNGLRTLVVIEFVRYRSTSNTVQQCQAEFLCSTHFWMLFVIMNDLNVLYWWDIRPFYRIRKIVVNGVLSSGKYEFHHRGYSII